VHRRELNLSLQHDSTIIPRAQNGHIKH
jgi:hypothetical protein